MSTTDQDPTTDQTFTDQELLDAPTDGRRGRAVTVQRHEVLDWLGPVDLYADRAQRLEIADAILASGSDDETTWLAIMERMTGQTPVPAPWTPVQQAG